MSNLKEQYNFYKGWPKYGKYYNKLNDVYYLLYNYLINFSKMKHNIKHKRNTVIFDIDDTLVFTDHLNIFPNKRFPNNWIRGYMLFPEIPQIVNIIKLCKQLGFKIIIITARPYESESSSKKNLELLGIQYDEIYHNKNYPDLNFKIQLKQKLSKTNNIILSVGDQWPDIQGLNNCLGIKLPSLEDHNAYFTYDNINYYEI
jgi:predicted secreted acid phosphatase